MHENDGILFALEIFNSFNGGEQQFTMFTGKLANRIAHLNVFKLFV